MIYLRLKEAQDLHTALTKAAQSLYSLEGDKLFPPAITLQQVAGVFSLLLGAPTFIEGIKPGYLRDGQLFTYNIPTPEFPEAHHERTDLDTGAGAGSGGNEDVSEGDKGVNPSEDKRRFVHPI